jgi:GNAT superfamily N-acetyltransferase
VVVRDRSRAPDDRAARPAPQSGTASQRGLGVDCLLWRDVEGHRRGALFHYRGDIPGGERRGNVNMWVDPAWHRRGIGRALLAEADRRWVLNFGQQSYTAGGLALVRSHLARSRRRGRG